MMHSVAVWMRNVFQKTVWSHVMQAEIPPRYELIYTAVLPFKYFMIGMYGLLSIGAPITSIDLVFGDIYGDIWSTALATCGFGAVIGVIFYNRLIWLEALATVTMVTLMLLYVGCILTAFLLGAEAFRFLSLLLVMIFLPMPSWRVYDIVRELRPPRHV